MSAVDGTTDEPPAGAAAGPGRPVALAIGWATVELERAAADLRSLLAPGAGFRRTQASIHLGAHAWVGRIDPERLRADAPTAAAWVILLEPSTEGRLAATLARRGEGWCAEWWPLATSGPAALVPGTPRSLLRPGPIGDERLLLAGPVWGPHRLVVEAATIRP